MPVVGHIIRSFDLHGADRRKHLSSYRLTIEHSVFLMAVMGVLSMLFAFVFPGHVPVVPPR